MVHKENEVDNFDGVLRRFNVEIFIVHPEINPSEITLILGVKPQNAHRVGDTRVTPHGRVIGGKWPDTRWRYSTRHKCKSQLFAKEIDTFVDSFLLHKSFFKHLVESGGSAEIIVKFLGDEYFGDTVSWQTLAKLSDMKLSFGIESFLVPQNE